MYLTWKGGHLRLNFSHGSRSHFLPSGFSGRRHLVVYVLIWADAEVLKILLQISSLYWLLARLVGRRCVEALFEELSC